MVSKMERKIILVTQTEAYMMISDLRNGEPTHNGDRTSRYIDIAKGYGEKMGRTVKAALIEEKSGLPKSEQAYAIHIINDVDESDCRIFETNHLDEEELESLLGTILDALEDGRL